MPKEIREWSDDMNISARASGMNQEPKIIGADSVTKSNLMQMTSELEIGENKVLEGRIQAKKEGSVEVQIKGDKGNSNITLDIKESDLQLLKEGQEVEVTVKKVSTHEVKIEIQTMLLVDEEQKIGEMKLDTNGIKKALYQSNSPLIYAKSLESTIEKTAEEIYSFLEQIADEDVRAIVQTEFDLSKMTLDLLRQVSYSDQISRQVRLTEDGVEVNIQEDKVEELSKKFLHVSGMQNMESYAFEASVKALLKAGVKVSSQNVEKMGAFLSKVDRIQTMSSSELIRFLSTDKEATINEMYKSTFYSGNKEKSDVLREEDFASIEEKVRQLVQEEFAELSTEKQEEIFGLSKQLILKGISIDERAIEAIRFVYEDTTSDRLNQVIDFAAQALSKRRKPEMLTVSELNHNRNRVTSEDVEALLKVVQEITKVDTRPVLSQILQAGKIPSLHEIEIQMKKQNQFGVNSLEKENQSIQPEFHQAVNREIENLEVIRYQMTFRSAMKLKIDGVDVKSMQLSELRERLEVIQGVKSPSETGQQEEQVREIYQKLSVIRGSSTKFIADIATGAIEKSLIHIESLYQKAQKGIDRYDLLRTQPRADLGDQIEVAFANAESLLIGLEMESSEENMRAVEILGRNQMNITMANIEKVRQLDGQLQQLFRVLKPEFARQLLSNKVDLLHEPLDRLIQKTEELEMKVRIHPEEKLARALHIIMENPKYSQDEKDALLSVYKMIYRIEKSNNSAIGTLLATGREVNLANLLQVTKYVDKGLTRGSKSTEFQVDDTFGLLENQEELEFSVKKQIDAVLYKENKEMLEMVQEMPQKTIKDLLKYGNITLGEINSFEQLRKNEFALKDKMEQLQKALERQGVPEFEISMKEVEDAFFGRKTTSISELFVREQGSQEVIKIAKEVEQQFRIVQKMNQQEHFDTIPVVINGQYQQMNLYYREQESRSESQGEALRLYMSYSTENLGRVNLRVDMEENRTKIAYSCPNDIGKDLLKSHQKELGDIFLQMNFPTVEMGYEEFEVPSPMVREETKNAERVLKKYKESKFEI